MDTTLTTTLRGRNPAERERLNRVRSQSAADQRPSPRQKGLSSSRARRSPESREMACQISR